MKKKWIILITIIIVVLLLLFLYFFSLNSGAVIAEAEPVEEHFLTGIVKKIKDLF